MNPMNSTDWPDRSRLGWWAFLLALAAATLYVAWSFVGIVVLGLFGYYATRPICKRIKRIVDSERIAATLTVFVVLLPLLLLVIYAGIQIVAEIQRSFGGSAVSELAATIVGLDAIPFEQRQQLIRALHNPLSVGTGAMQGSIWSSVEAGLKGLQAIFGAIILISLSLTLSYVLLARDRKIKGALTQLFGGPDTTAYGYALAVDDDLESVFFGNLLFVVIMAVIATVAYAATNFLAPEGLHIPMVIVLGFLTGATSIIPVVVGKLVYLPVVGFLAFQAMRAEGGHLAFVGGALVAYVLVLDLLPQTFIQPYVSGRKFDMMILLFAYILGPILFGWYGFFLLPILAILVFEAIRIVLPELVHGIPLSPDPMLGRNAVPDPQDSDEEYDGDGSDADADSDGSQPSTG